jgi:hypothetical protein
VFSKSVFEPIQHGGELDESKESQGTLITPGAESTMTLKKHALRRRVNDNEGRDVDAVLEEATLIGLGGQWDAVGG